jgi:hypothetical protein
MAKKAKIALTVAVVFVGIVAAAFYAFNRGAVGIPAFFRKNLTDMAKGQQRRPISPVESILIKVLHRPPFLSASRLLSPFAPYAC